MIAPPIDHCRNVRLATKATADWHRPGTLWTRYMAPLVSDRMNCFRLALEILIGWSSYAMAEAQALNDSNLVECGRRASSQMARERLNPAGGGIVLLSVCLLMMMLLPSILCGLWWCSFVVDVLTVNINRLC
jgi:hypothetical protein